MSEHIPDTPQPAVGTAPMMRARRHATARTVMALMLREMSTRYGRTPGGYLWAIIEPLAAIILLSVGFSLLVRAPSLGESFVLFYATGYLPFSLYQSVSGTVARGIVFSKPLLFYPTVTWLDALLARCILNALTHITVSYILLTGILAYIDSRVVIEMPQIILAIGLATLLGFGVGVMNCFLMGIIPVWDLIWSIVTRPLFIASGVIFLYEDLPGTVQDILWYNPLMHITGIMRSGFFPMYNADYASVTFVVGTGLIPLALGLVMLARYHKNIIND